MVQRYGPVFFFNFLSNFGFGVKTQILKEKEKEKKVLYLISC